MPRKGLWVTYDLGIKGDYEGMYVFLDGHKAVECGDSAAFLSFEFSTDVLEEFEEELKRFVDFDKRSRVYVIYPKPEGGYKGSFVVGRRKPPPWAGYVMPEASEEDVGE